MSCWNVGTTCSWSLGKKVPGSKRLVTRQVKRLVLSGVIPTQPRPCLGWSLPRQNPSGSSWFNNPTILILDENVFEEFCSQKAICLPCSKLYSLPCAAIYYISIRTSSLYPFFVSIYLEPRLSNSTAHSLTQ